MRLEARPSNENLRRDEAAERSGLVTTHDYAIHVDFSQAEDPAVPSYPVTTRIAFDATEGSATFLDYLGYSLESITLNGTALNPEDVVDGARLRLSGLAASNVVEIVSASAYSRSGEGVHRFVDPADGNTYLYSQNEPADARRIFPNFEQPDLKARFSISITAPDQWHAASNGALVGLREAGGANSTREFATTEPMSTYITTFLAGPYALWNDHYEGVTASGEAVTVPLGIATRASLAASMDAHEVFDLTKRGLDWFHTHFDIAYPWGKYDQAFVPEYNLGAMENPGLVTFTERYVFTSPATEAQHEQRANTIMHEMCHMWFGDLVTMAWWDDLWLKESFADYVGTLVVDEATDFTTAWTTFASRRKAWAYRQDQYPTTHPIVADITDLEAADQNFDGITYAKGASVLKQLSAFVGQDAFLAAARAYFTRHAWGNTRLSDFLSALEEASGRDMGAWAEAWLQTAGVNRLSLELTEAEGKIASATLVQDGIDPRSGETVLRPHVAKVGVYSPAADAPAARTAQVAVLVEGARTPVPELVGTPLGSAWLVNDEDLSYAKIGMDESTLRIALGEGLDDELARATALAGAWNLVRDATLPVERFVDGVVSNAGLIEDSGVLAQSFAQAGSGLESYTLAGDRQELLARWVTYLLESIVEAPEPSDERTVRLRALFASLAEQQTPDAQSLEVTEAWLADDEFALGEELAWAALVALAAHGRRSEEELRAADAAAPTAISATGLTRALAARPLAAAKDAARAAAYSGADASGATLSNDHLQATIDGLGIDPSGVGVGHEDEYFERIADVWAQQTQGQATRVVEGLFPAGAELDDGDGATHPTVLAAESWLAAHAEAPAALRRLVIERLDDVRRRLGAQAASQRG
ncbi:aminopeptidase N [Galactobacter valiniphilus]|uniref:Aminopeptidase N n=1 Tax=Galactobacter valiniphilus TaxID=2676122 RepID=A0A399J9I9_9MICC|nr:aminopeptidase N [Galactobacter valiniphilus]RII42198.1 aminopeptidase N [Galactobacter valiniphilus]